MANFAGKVRMVILVLSYGKHCSCKHFQRVFSCQMGNGLKDYIIPTINGMLSGGREET